MEESLQMLSRDEHKNQKNWSLTCNNSCEKTKAGRKQVPVQLGHTMRQPVSKTNIQCLSNKIVSHKHQLQERYGVYVSIIVFICYFSRGDQPPGCIGLEGKIHSVGTTEKLRLCQGKKTFTHFLDGSCFNSPFSLSPQLIQLTEIFQAVQESHVTVDEKDQPDDSHALQVSVTEQERSIFSFIGRLHIVVVKNQSLYYLS